MKLGVTLITSALIVLILAPTVAAGVDDECIYIDNITVTFHDGDANISIRYHMDTFTRFYYLLLGGRYIEPGITNMFADFEDITLTQINGTHTSVEVKNISRFEGDHYQSRPSKLNQQIRKTVFSFPDGSSRTFIGLDILPPLQYEIK